MSRLPIVDAKTLERVLFSLGFQRVRHHPGCDLARPLIREILREIKLSPTDYVKALGTV